MPFANYQEFINAQVEKDTSLHNLLGFLAYTRNYKTTKNMTRPVQEWTEGEILTAIRGARTDVSLGRIPLFESGDRVRNFRSRMATSEAMISELNKLNVGKVNAYKDACTALQQSRADVPQIKNDALYKAALNWVPFLKNQNLEHIPSALLESLTEENQFCEAHVLNMLEIIEDTDMNEFAYTDNESFAANFAKKYEKLKALADGPALVEYIRSKNNDTFHSKRMRSGEADDSSRRVIEAKSKMAADMIRDYELRMRIITSPFYALFSGKDFEKLSAQQIRAMKKGEGSEALDTYLEDVIKFKNRKAESFKGVNVNEKLVAYTAAVRPDKVIKSEETFKEMDALIRTMYADTKRASAYKKLRTELKKYIDAKDREGRIIALPEVITAVNVYLQERGHSSYEYRKERCEQMIALHDRYNQELDEEMQGIKDMLEAKKQEKLQREQQAEQRRQEEAEQATDRVRREAELEAKAKQRWQKLEEKIEKDEALVRTQEKERLEGIKIRAKRERDLEIKAKEYEMRIAGKRLRDDIQKKMEKAQENAKSFMAKYEASEAEKAEIRRGELRFIMFEDAMNEAIEKYESLNQIGKTANDSKEARKAVLDFLDKYVFNESSEINEKFNRDYLEIMPTAMLVDAIKAHKQEVSRQVFDEGKYAEIIKKDILDKSFEVKGTHDEMRKPFNDAINKKPEEITEQDRLDVYDFAIHVLSFAGGELEYTDLEGRDLSKLSKLSLQVIDLDESYPDFESGETFESLSDEQRQAHVNAAASVLQFFTGVDAELFKFLPVGTISQYTYDVLGELLDPEEQKKILTKCHKEAKSLKERHDLLKEALESGDRIKIMQTIAAVSGEDQSALDEVPTPDLKVVVGHMLENFQDKEKMMNALGEEKQALLARDEDYYREKFLELETKRREGKLAEGEAELRREYGFTYVKKSLEMDKIPHVALSGLKDEELYTLVSNIGVIKYLDGEDNKKAVEAIKGLKLSPEIGSALNKALKSKMVKDRVPLFGADDVDLNYATETALSFESLTTAPKGKGRAPVKNPNIINEEKPVEQKEPGAWNSDSARLLEFIGDLYLAAEKDPLDINAVMPFINANGDLIASHIKSFNKDSSVNIMGDLLRDLAPQERVLVEGARPVLDAIANFVIEKAKEDPKFNPKYASSRTVKSVLSKHPLDIDLRLASKQLNDAVKKGEPELINMMQKATADPFDQVEGYGIPNIFNVDNKVENDKETLAFEQDSLRYNINHGQGKFFHTLMNNYYQESAPSDKRKMLSLMIKDFKRNDKRSDISKGGDYFASTLKGAGPVMQKMMQGVPEFMVIPELRNALNVVKSDLAPIDKNYVNSVVEDIKKKSGDTVTDIQLGDSLGAASVAQTFACKVTGPKLGKQDAVIKILRPDAEQHMKRELPVIKRAAIFADMNEKEIEQFKAKNPGNKISPHTTRATEAGFLAQLSEIEKEFNFKNEAKNIETGKKKYKGKDKMVDSVELIDVPTGENYLLMSRAKGKTLDRFIKESRKVTTDALEIYKTKDNPKQKYMMDPSNLAMYEAVFHDLNKQMKAALQYGEYVGKVAKVWTEEALYGSAWSLFNDYNFRHGDLHSGNIMIDEEGATILDYGNASMLHHEKVTEILKMMSCVVLKKPEWFVESFSNLLKMAKKEDDAKGGVIGYEELSPKVKAEYIERLRKIFETGTPETAGIKVLLALTTAQTLGIKLPIELQNFSQCQQRLENSMGEVRQAAIGLRRSLDELERMPIDKSLIASCDPHVVFRRQMLRKNAKDGDYKYEDSYQAAKALLDEFDPPEIHDYMMDNIPISKAFNEGKNITKQLEEYKRKYFIQYGELCDAMIGGENVNLKTFPAKIEEFRKIYNDMKEEYNKTGKYSTKTVLNTSFMSGFFTASANTTGLFTDYETKENISELNKRAFSPPFDDLAFEKMMAMCAVDLVQIAEHNKILEYGIKMSALDDKQRAEFAEKNADVQRSMRVAMLKKQNHVADFVEKLRNTERIEQFEKEMERFFSANPMVLGAYRDYKKAREAYNSLTAENSPKQFIEARKKLINLEDKLVDTYCENCRNTFQVIKEVTKDAYTMKDVVSTTYLPEYVDVIYKVMLKYKVSTYKRLGSKYKDEFERQEKLEEEERKKAKAAEEKEAQKADPKSKVDPKADAKSKKEEPKKAEAKAKSKSDQKADAKKAAAKGKVEDSKAKKEDPKAKKFSEKELKKAREKAEKEAKKAKEKAEKEAKKLKEKQEKEAKALREKQKKEEAAKAKKGGKRK